MSNTDRPPSHVPLTGERNEYIWKRWFANLQEKFEDLVLTAGTGDMLSTNNLSDVADAGTSRTNLGVEIGTDVQAWDADLDTFASTGEAAYLLKDGTRAWTGTQTTLNVTNSIDQTYYLGEDTKRYLNVNGRLGAFVGTSASNGTVTADNTTRTFGTNQTGIMAGNQVRQGLGTATHKMTGGAFKAAICCGNAWATGAGNAILDNSSGGSSLFGSAFSYGAGNATVKATSFGNFTAFYTYCTGKDHTFTNAAPGGFLAGYSQGPGQIDCTNSGPGAFCNIRPQNGHATAALTITNSGTGCFTSGHIWKTSTTAMTFTNSCVGGAFIGAVKDGNITITNGINVGGASFMGFANGASVSVTGAGAGVRGIARGGNNMSATGGGAWAFGDSNTGVIAATASNTTQFGPGTNATANSLQVGANTNLRADGSIFLQEKAAATASIAAWGQVWVKNTTPAELWFTDDAGTSTKIV